MFLTVDERSIEVNDSGNLVRLSDWDEAVARFLAAEDGLVLGDEHWVVLFFVRGFYEQFGRVPGVRPMVAALKDAFGDDVGSGAFLQKLFPEGAAVQAVRLAGLPRSKRCV